MQYKWRINFDLYKSILALFKYFVIDFQCASDFNPKLIVILNGNLSQPNGDNVESRNESMSTEIM